MNGAQQVERFTAVSRLEKRLADLELVVDAQTALILKQKEVIDQDLQVFNERLRVYAEQEAYRLDGADSLLAGRLEVLEHRTLWQWLRWFVRGA